MGDNTLQFIPIKLFQKSGGDSDGGVLGVATGGEGIQAGSSSM
jgi:hypothetical protein